MVTEQLQGASIATQANVFFEGKCVSHTVILANGEKKSVGVVLPSHLTFNTAAAETMECVAGACEYKLAGTDTWQHAADGDQFSVGANSSFEIKVTEAYHYICHFG
jgi:uncharacterized protein YaiE (UPF0345 family)